MPFTIYFYPVISAPSSKPSAVLVVKGSLF